MFSRDNRASGRHARSRRDARPSRPSLAEELGAADDEPTDLDAATGPEATQEPPGGPYDISEAPGGVRRLDLGSLQIPSVPGVDVRVQANPEGVVQQVVLVHGPSALQLGVFAAPRSEPVWDEVRADIRKQLFDDGVAAEDVTGPYGTELRARVRTPEGLKDLRFVGVDGPRWLVRAVYQGPAAADPGKAGPLTECLRGLVVDRGDEARPVKEPLPLRLSPEMAAQLTAPAGQGAGPAGQGAGPAGQSAAAAGQIPSTGGAPAGQSAAPAGQSAAPRRKPSPRPRRQPTGRASG